MKKQSLRFLTSLIGSVLISMAVATSTFAYPSGAPAGYTGSPGDGATCVSCHGGGTAATVTGWITSNIPATGYVPGTVYTLTATVTGTGKKGFEVSPQNVSGTQLGILAAGTGSHLVGGTKYVTQNSAGASAGTSTYVFTWTAPVAGTGTVTFYGAFCVGKSNTRLSTLIADEDLSMPLAATASAAPDLICAGQTSQLNVLPTGGSGNYTYSWTSVPAGFTSSLQNPVVSPAISTQYIAHVSDGALSVDAPTNVTVNELATANAGSDTTFSPDAAQVPLNGFASNYSAVLWSTSGTGTFSAGTSLAGNYLPSAADRTVGNSVTLTLTASAQLPCTTSAIDTRIIHFDWPTGVADAKNGQIGMVISPNPSHGLVTLKVSGIDGEDATITICDITGRTIGQRTMNSGDIHQERFDLSAFPHGLYLVKIQSETGSLVRKLVIE